MICVLVSGCRYCSIMMLLIFFFKQKTAYEMRISDWSSDVCSSDLRRWPVIAIGKEARLAFVKGVWRIFIAIKDGLVLLFMLLFFGLLYAALSFYPRPATVAGGALVLKLDGAIVEQIGRASCRERVCQDV